MNAARAAQRTDRSVTILSEETTIKVKSDLMRRGEIEAAAEEEGKGKSRGGLKAAHAASSLSRRPKRFSLFHSYFLLVTSSGPRPPFGTAIASDFSVFWSNDEVVLIGEGALVVHLVAAFTHGCKAVCATDMDDLVGAWAQVD